MKRFIIAGLFLIILCGIAPAQTTGTKTIQHVTHSFWTHHTTGALSHSLDQSTPLVILEVRLKLNAAGGAGNFTITLNHGTNAALDVVMVTQDMTTATSVHWIPTRPVVLSRDDVLDCAYANANNKTYGCEIIWREL